MPLEVPNLTLLRHFVAVAEDRGITKAARRLRISQPALSKNIRKLEQLLGVQLFERHSGGAELTEAGQRFFRHAQTIGVEYQHALQEMQNLLSEHAATIRMGTGPVWTSTVIPEALPRYHKRFPNHRLLIQTGAVDQMIEDLRVGRIDIFAGALIRQNQLPGFVRRPLATADLAIMCSPDHPLMKLERPARPEEIARYPFVSFVATRDVIQILSDAMKSLGAPPPRFLVETSSIYASVELARTGEYLFFESAMIARNRIGQGLVQLPSTLPARNFDMGFVYRAGLDSVSSYRGILKAMEDVLAEHVATMTPPA
ncbi:LysR family transcriptional regulator [Martelella sp. HB161492]|uniref:LysR family transcriptional regulator n=1 Tax=Martelella sp. HB161492 TaxID=2720726 RepID=UPI001590D615|nr:LysR family transcriptional regulator [Martelella sp. HB161492]